MKLNLLRCLHRILELLQKEILNSSLQVLNYYQRKNKANVYKANGFQIKLLHGKSWIRNLHGKSLFELAASWLFHRWKQIYTWSFNEITINIFVHHRHICVHVALSLSPPRTSAHSRIVLFLIFSRAAEQLKEQRMHSSTSSSSALDGNFGEHVGWWTSRVTELRRPYHRLLTLS